jgi:hypothetical protein
VTTVCFGDGVYDPGAFETCFSNLIAVGFRRTVIDLYWDVEERSFILCPVHVPSFSNDTSNEAANAIPRVTPRSELYVGELERRQDETSNPTSSSTAFAEGNPSSSSPTLSSSNSTTNTSTTTSATFSVPTSDGEDGSTLFALGDVNCAQGLNLDSIIDIIIDYIGDSSDASAATLQILEFNLHSARSATDPNGPPRNFSPDEFPSASQLIGSRFNSEMGNQLYSPVDLAVDRANLNNSWFQVRSEERLPMTGYFNIESRPDGNVATDDGWPNELYLLLTRLERVILTWGTVSEEMEGYNFAVDETYIFPRGAFSDEHSLQLNADGVVTSGCFYRDDEKSVSQINNTWAVVSLNNTGNLSKADLENITSCGVSPFLSTTLNRESAADYQPYQLFGQSMVLGWADGEPRNTSSPGTNVDENQDQFRCVVIDSTTDYRGKWRVVSCQDHNRAACRVGGQPYGWRLSTSVTDFTGAPNSCPEGSSFDLPVTHLENTYLYEHILSDTTGDSSVQRGVYINLNSLDDMSCWVTTGPNGTCRYQQNSQEQHNREVLVPTIAALIILLLTVLTILVKCNVNRRNNRRHRVGPGGWEYEGVPS